MGPLRRSSAEPALPQALAELVSAARAAWPTLDVPRAHFISFLYQVLPAEVLGLDDLGHIHSGDLYLVCAYGTGAAAAALALESHYRPTVALALRRMGLPSPLAQDIWQVLLQRLLSGAQGGRGAYHGSGSLRGWLRTSAVREARRAGHRAARHLPLRDSLSLTAATGPDAMDLLLMLHRYGAAFHEAFVEALRSISTAERALLQRYYIDGLGVVAIGRLHGVNATTAWRWLEGCRQVLFQRTRRNFRRRVPVSVPEFHGIARLLHDQLNLSLGAMLVPEAS